MTETTPISPDAPLTQPSEPRTRPRHLPLLVGVLAVVACISWFAGVRWHFQPKNFGIVEPGVLYRSAALTPAATKLVHDEYRIRTIVDLGAFDRDPEGDVIAQRTAESLGVKRLVFRLEGDGTGNPNAYVQALTVINDPANHPVLLHCSAGAQRTSGCVILYKQIIKSLPFDPAYDEAQTYKHDPRRNPRLKPYLMTWQTRIAESYRSRTAIPGFDPLGLPTPAAAD